LATTYNLYRDGQLVVSGLTEKTYTDTDLNPNTDYEYAVRAVNENGQSDLSDAITVHTDFSPVSDVSLDQDVLEINVGDNTTLVATVSPSTAEQTVSWLSSDESIATVDDNGNISAVSEGNVTIKVTSSSDSSISASCDVTVGAD